MKHMLIRLSSYLRNIYYSLKYYLTFIFTKPNENYILFDSYSGLNFNDNPKAIFDKLLTSNKKIVWVFKDTDLINFFNKNYPEYTAIKYNSLKHYYYLNKCKYWIFNYKTPTYFKKRKGITFIQTWHGIPLKKLGCDIEDNGQKFYRSQQSYQQMCQSYKNEAKKCDYFIAPSKYAKEKFISSFNLDKKKIIETQYPRNDKLLNYQEKDIISIRKKLNIDNNKKVILYAPTWRDNNSTFLKGYQEVQLLDFNKLVQLKDDYIILYRPHYLISEKVDLTTLKKFIIDVSQYQEINDLYLISDLLITDYSSVYFDYSLLKRPIYFYMPDLSTYKDNLRGFYIDIDTDLPNDYYTTTDSLLEAINSNYVNLEKQHNFYSNNVFYSLDYEIILNKLK